MDVLPEDTNSNTIIADPSFLNGVMAINAEDVSEEASHELSSQWFKLRADDINFVIDSVKSAAGANTLPEYWYAQQSEDIIKALAVTDTDSIGEMGHSLGGAAAVSIGRIRNDIGAVIDFDGTMLGEVTGGWKWIILYLFCPPHP